MPTLLRYILPLSYVLDTRLNHLKHIAASGYMEWVPSTLLIWWFADVELWRAPLLFALGWLAFMSVYELGYMMNDLYSTRFEDDPRERSDAEAGPIEASVWVITRLGCVGAIAWHFGWYEHAHWWSLLVILAPIYVAHNLLRRGSTKISTFVGLATIRFLAPSAPFLTPAQMTLVFGPAFLHYVSFRTLSYMDSKGLLAIPERQTAGFRIKFHAIHGGVTAILAILHSSWLPLVFTSYYLSFWLVVGLAQLIRRGEGSP